MSQSMTVLKKVIERWLREESYISPSQYDLMPGRGMRNAIVANRQLCEKYWGVH